MGTIAVSYHRRSWSLRIRDAMQLVHARAVNIYATIRGQRVFQSSKRRNDLQRGAENGDDDGKGGRKER